MANIRKSFNFRNGVQIDTNNFIVNPLGLVGIGTSIPAESLDVVGNARIQGITSTSNLQSTFLSAVDTTIDRINLRDSIIGSGVSIQSGIITNSEPTGVVTYYGDGRYLRNVISQWVDIDVGLGFTSIYNTGFVGISTIDPRFTLQVGGNNDPVAFEGGVGISRSGNIWATGIVTGGNFVGGGSGLTSLNADNISSGTVDNAHIPVISSDRLPDSANFTGIVTALGYVTVGDNIDITGIGTIGGDIVVGGGATIGGDTEIAGYATIDGNVDATGIGTIGGDIVVGGGATIGGNTEIAGYTTIDGNIDATGIGTIGGDIVVGGGATIGGYAEIGSYATIGGYTTIDGNVDATGIGTIGGDIVVGGGATIGGNTKITGNTSITGIVSATGAEISYISAGIATALLFDGDLTGNAGSANVLSVGSNINDVLFTGTTDITVDPYIEDDDNSGSDRYIVFTDNTVAGYKRLNEDSSLVYNPSANRLNVGVLTASSSVRTDFLGIKTSTTSFGHTIDVQQTISAATISLGSSENYSGIFLSRDSGNIGRESGLLRYGNVSAGYPYSRADSLDLINFGGGNVNYYLQQGPTIGINTGSFIWHDKFGPIAALTYEGNFGIGVTNPTNRLSVVGTSTFTSSAHFNGNVTIDGSLSINSLEIDSLNTDVNGTLTGNVYATSGISTFNDVLIDNAVKATYIGIGTDISGATSFGVNFEDRLFTITSGGQVGIRTDATLLVNGINASTTDNVFGSIGVATDRINSNTTCAVDFGQVGSGYTSIRDITSREFMRVPRVTAAQIAAFTGLIGGEIVYDTDANVHKGYNGTTWNNLY